MAPELGPVEISPVRSPRQFLDLQRGFYRDDPDYVPPLTLADRWQVDPRKNPFFEHAEATFVMAARAGRPVGRISAVRDPELIERRVRRVDGGSGRPDGLAVHELDQVDAGTLAGGAAATHEDLDLAGRAASLRRLAVRLRPDGRRALF